ncbi:hypothetical protein HK098_002479 [Nowakowskiella sp. JEL0407]|nr:hypothetical protein HK098_002479 [Nowakowskiella sp. JEL0407]
MILHLAEKLATDERKSFVYDNILFHFLQKNEVVYLSICDTNAGRRRPFIFLELLENEWTSTSQGASSSSKGRKGLDLNAFIAQFNETPDTFTDLKTSLSSVQSILTTNIEKVLDRNERIDTLLSKTETLTNNSFAFKKRATGLKHKLVFENIAGWTAVSLGVAGVLGLGYLYLGGL